MRKSIIALGFGAIILLGGCGSADSGADAPASKPPASSKASTPKATEDSTPDLPDVEWGDYAPAVKKRIDHLAAGKKCGKLQREFTIADQNSDATMARTGHSNANLMIYIDAQMQAANCY